MRHVDTLSVFFCSAFLYGLFMPLISMCLHTEQHVLDLKTFRIKDVSNVMF